MATRLASTDARHPRRPRNARAKQPSSARQHAGPRQKNGVASAARPTIVPTRRIVRRATDLLRHAAIAVVLFAFLAPVVARAHSAEALQQFETGKQAFAAQDYATALDAFEAAAAAGMSGPAVHFNIGVCAYRLGRWSRAEAAFREVARTPQMAALAHYNLGLVALGDGKPRRSSSLVRAGGARSERTNGCDRWRRRSCAQLPRPPERNWLAYGSLAAGYDDNVALVSGGDVLGVSGTDDTFAELQLAAAAPLVGPWRFDGGLVLLDYQDLDSFDQLSVNAGARYRLPLGDWTGEAALQLVVRDARRRRFREQADAAAAGDASVDRRMAAARALSLQRHRRTGRLRRPGWTRATSSAFAAPGAATAGM